MVKFLLLYHYLNYSTSYTYNTNDTNNSIINRNSINVSIEIKFMIEMKLTCNKEYCILKPNSTSIKLIWLLKK